MSKRIGIYDWTGPDPLFIDEDALAAQGERDAQAFAHITEQLDRFAHATLSSTLDFDESQHPRDEHGRFTNGDNQDAVDAWRERRAGEVTAEQRALDEHAYADDNRYALHTFIESPWTGRGGDGQHLEGARDAGDMKQLVENELGKRMVIPDEVLDRPASPTLAFDRGKAGYVSVDALGEATLGEIGKLNDLYELSRSFGPVLEYGLQQASSSEHGDVTAFLSRAENDLGITLSAERGWAAMYIDGWQQSAGDTRVGSLALQVNAGELFGGEMQLGHLGAYAGEVRDLAAEEKPIADAFLAAQRDYTRERLTEAGVTDGHSITLVRGIVLPDPIPGGPGDHTVAANPLSSWTTDLDTAQEFGTDMSYGHGYVLTADVPVANVVGSTISGLGSLSEHEVIVNLQPDQVIHVEEYDPGGRFGETTGWNPDGTNPPLDPWEAHIAASSTLDFDESLHPRDEHGRFTSGGGDYSFAATDAELNRAAVQTFMERAAYGDKDHPAAELKQRVEAELGKRMDVTLAPVLDEKLPSGVTHSRGNYALDLLDSNYVAYHGSIDEAQLRDASIGDLGRLNDLAELSRTFSHDQQDALNGLADTGRTLGAQLDRVEEALGIDLSPGRGWAGAYIDGWMGSAADHSLGALALQYNAGEMFGTPFDMSHLGGDNVPGLRPMGDDVRDRAASEKPMMDAFLTAQRDYTREQLAEAGVTDGTVKLTRGVIVSDANAERLGDVGEHTITSNPLSSWSTDTSTAETFAGRGGGGGAGRIITADVPVESIVGSTFSGLGSLGEYELIVNLPPDQVVTISKPTGDAAYDILGNPLK